MQAAAPLTTVRPLGMSVEPDLPHIIAQSQAGDANAISEIYRLYAGSILRFLYARLNEQETAKDLTQEVFIRVMKGIGGFEYRGEKSFLGWLYTIATNVLIGHVRRSNVQHMPLDDNSELVDPRGQEGVFAVFDRVALQQAIQRLTVDQQQVLSMRFFADMSNAEIARQTRRTEGAVKALQHRALQSLQQIMAHDNDDQMPHKRAMDERVTLPNLQSGPVSRIEKGQVALSVQDELLTMPLDLMNEG